MSPSASFSSSRNLGALMRVLVLGFFTISVIVYGIKEGVHGLSGSAFSPTGAIFLAIVPGSTCRR